MTLNSAFYKAFEDRFRGTAEDLSIKFAVYDRLIERLESVEERFAVDLGCGRGEWLASLMKRDWRARGVDLNHEMCLEARESGVPVFEGDLLAFLKQQADGSIDLLTAFHVIEHLPIDAVCEVFRESARVLKPRGCLLFETPNPENLRVGTDLFYLDPTHQKPLSPELVQFIATWSGFQVAKIVRIHSPRLYSNDGLLGQQFETFLHYSPDYACIASKDSEFAPLDQLIDGDFGPSTQRFYDVADQLHQNLKSTDTWVAEENQHLAGLIDHLQGRIDHLQEQVNHLVDALWHSRKRSLGWHLAEMKERLLSRLRRTIKVIHLTSKAMVRAPFVRLASWVVRRPRVKRLAVRCLNCMPMLSRIVGRVLATEQSHIGIDGAIWRTETRQLISTREQELFERIHGSTN